MSEQLQAPSDTGILAQILVTTTQTQTDVAVMKEQMKAVPDHETRIRLLEASRARLMGGVTLLGALSGSAGGAIIGWALSHR